MEIISLTSITLNSRVKHSKFDIFLRIQKKKITFQLLGIDIIFFQKITVVFKKSL